MIINIKKCRYIQFEGDESDTDIYLVRNIRHGSMLGRVEFYAGWRCYVFAPIEGTDYSSDCLRDIAAFCDERLRARGALAAQKGGKLVPKPEGEPK